VRERRGREEGDPAGARLRGWVGGRAGEGGRGERADGRKREDRKRNRRSLAVRIISLFRAALFRGIDVAISLS